MYEKPSKHPTSRILASDSPRSEKYDLIFDLDRDLKFSAKDFNSFYLPDWNQTVYDAMIVAAAVEFADRAVMRWTSVWRREFELDIAVHDPDRWNSKTVSIPLHKALRFLTGDIWKLHFVRRRHAFSFERQPYLDFKQPTSAILAYSDGMDSRAVRGILGAKLGKQLVCVRVGGKRRDESQPFTNIPYHVKTPTVRNKETSARNRGFKFATISAIASYLTHAERIVIPESGQGSIGPALVTTGHIYPDFRNHPRFTSIMSDYVSALFEREVVYEYPRLWNTKGETLKTYSGLPGGEDWTTTISCWRGNNWSSVEGKHRQCGACAACMLRRLSVNAAGLSEKSDKYIASDLSKESFEAALHPRFNRGGRAFTEYAIAGVLHMQHLADMSNEENEPLLRRHAIHLAIALKCPVNQTLSNLRTMINRHTIEWNNFLNELGEHSFIWKWARN